MGSSHLQGRRVQCWLLLMVEPPAAAMLIVSAHCVCNHCCRSSSRWGGERVTAGASISATSICSPSLRPASPQLRFRGLARARRGRLRIVAGDHHSCGLCAGWGVSASVCVRVCVTVCVCVLVCVYLSVCLRARVCMCARWLSLWRLLTGRQGERLFVLVPSGTSECLCVCVGVCVCL